MNQVKELVREIKERKPKRILLQLPEGLKTKAIQILDGIEAAGIAVILSGDACYGACDLRINEACTAKCDLIVHVGHNKFYRDIKSDIPVLYFPWKMQFTIDKKLPKQMNQIAEKRIGLLSSIQYIDYLDEFSRVLKDAGKKPVMGGQILGCYAQNADKIKDDVDCFLFAGTGRFHPLGLSFLHKKTYFYDLEKNMIEDLSKEMMIEEKKRMARIEKARDANIFAILVSSKHGQFDLVAAEKVKKALEGKHKKAFIVIMDEIRDEKLLGLGVDCFINTACPRIAGDKFSKAILNAKDVEEII
jgi:2-(3-amino-3-carboxypropyl)histidine synthase